MVPACQRGEPHQDSRSSTVTPVLLLTFSTGSGPVAPMENKTFTVTRKQLTTPTKQTCLVTGGSSGIGLNTAIILHELGNNVVVIDRSPPVAIAPKEVTSSPRFLFEQCDITSWSSQRSAFENAYKKFGSIDNVFVNAGIAEYGDQFFKDDVDSDGLLKEPDRRCVDIDLQAADDTVKLAIHYMRKKENNGRGKGGSIVMTASLAGYLASAGAPLYSAAKHGRLHDLRICPELAVAHNLHRYRWTHARTEE